MVGHAHRVSASDKGLPLGFLLAFEVHDTLPRCQAHTFAARHVVGLWWPLYGESVELEAELLPKRVAVVELLLSPLQQGEALGALTVTMTGGEEEEEKDEESSGSVLLTV